MVDLKREFKSRTVLDLFCHTKKEYGKFSKDQWKELHKYQSNKQVKNKIVWGGSQNVQQVDNDTNN